jgi:tetratricopeptide (TPR) repeat protein
VQRRYVTVIVGGVILGQVVIAARAWYIGNDNDWEPGLSAKQIECIKLNNDGVKALNQRGWQIACDKFEAALKVDPEYTMARDNLAIAHINHGLQLRQENKLPDALSEFHQAAYTSKSDPTKKPSRIDILMSETIQKMGKNPESLADRIELGEQASAKKDYSGAVVEYRAALELKSDAQVHKKLGDLFNLMGEKDKATAEYETAKTMDHGKPSGAL